MQGETTSDRWKCKERIYRKLAKIKYNIEHISVWNLGTSDIFNIIHRYELTENEENSRTSSFEEGAPDVAQNITKEPIFCYSRQVHIGGPLNAYWADGESLGLQISSWRGLTRPRRFFFAFVTSVSELRLRHSRNSVIG